MDRVFSFLLWPKREAHGPWKQGRKKRGSITCRTDRANEANKMFIIWLCWLFRFWKGDRELEVCTATYGPSCNWPITAREISQPYNKVIYYMAKGFYVLWLVNFRSVSSQTDLQLLINCQNVKWFRYFPEIQFNQQSHIINILASFARSVRQVIGPRTDLALG